MKKMFLVLVATVFVFVSFAQTQSTRKMRVWSDGSVVYQRDAMTVDSINFFVDNGESGDNGGSGDFANDTNQIYAGVVAFNRFVNQLPISSDLESVKSFITAQTNNQDQTAFAYSVSKGNLMFDADGLPEFDKIFMLNFSDGTDNYSNKLWGDEGRKVITTNVYDTVQYDLSQRLGLNSYAIGFGDDVGFGEKMRQVVMGSGEYHNAKTSAELTPTFNEIAQSIIASAKNVVLKTNDGYYGEGEKLFRFTFEAEGGLLDTIYAQIVGTPTTGYTLSITQEGKYAQFDAPVVGEHNKDEGKVLLPLNNLKFINGEEELQYNFNVFISFDGELYYEDVEEASTAEAVSKRIAVVLVLDCSQSMGGAFEPMKDAAIDFIETLEKMDPNAGEITPSTSFKTQTITANGVDFTMVAVEGGTFTMGATSEQGSDAGSNESPTHSVTLDNYYIGETEVTQALWYAVMGYKPTSSGSQWSSTYGLGDNYPAYYISWEDCQTFITKLNALTGKTFRMPTEAEWEYAARGGKESQGYKYSGSNTIGNVAWYTSNSSSKTHTVKGKTANELGLYDMSGNVWEWCSDWYGSYSSSAQTNPTGTSSGSFRVARGGGWDNDATDCRVSCRNYFTPSYRNCYLGFRLVLEP